MTIAKEEIFGPVMAIIKFKTEAEVCRDPLPSCLRLPPCLPRCVVLVFSSFCPFLIPRLTSQFIERANSTMFGLGGGVVTRDVSRVRTDRRGGLLSFFLCEDTLGIKTND
jgi:hypothetical protein